jgi:hypothetical protein
MKDNYWRATYHAVLPLLTRDDVVLAPRANWPDFPCEAKYYDGLIDVGDATVFLLNNDNLTGIKKKALAAIVADWQCVYANTVFTVFARSSRRSADARKGWRNIYLKRLRRYLRSRELKRRPSTIYYVHLPKTGGTSAWHRLSASVKSSIYYSSMPAFLENPPEPGEYDLVGGHFWPSALQGIPTEDDCVACLVRHPTERFLSGFVHSRRQGVDPKALSPSMSAMRNMRLAEFVQTSFGRYETRAQLIMLGTDHRRAFESYTDREMLDGAMAVVGRDNSITAPSHQSHLLVKELSRRLNIWSQPLRRLNANKRADYARYESEIQEALPLIESVNNYDRQLYDAVCARFQAQGR